MLLLLAVEAAAAVVSVVAFSVATPAVSTDPGCDSSYCKVSCSFSVIPHLQVALDINDDDDDDQ